jgi:hypothetical protein
VREKERRAGVGRGGDREREGGRGREESRERESFDGSALAGVDRPTPPVHSSVALHSSTALSDAFTCSPQYHAAVFFGRSEHACGQSRAGRGD